MDHRKFQQRLDELVAELTHAQAQCANRGAPSYRQVPTGGDNHLNRIRYGNSTACVAQAAICWSCAAAV